MASSTANEGLKENRTESAVLTPKPQSTTNYEKYTFQPFFKTDPAGIVQKKTEPTTAFNPSTFASPFPAVSQSALLNTGGFNFGTPVSVAPPSTISTSPGFKFGGSQSGDGLKRKADEGSISGGFNFGSSEPKLKLKATGTEAPTSVPSVGLKSGSVMDALKQPGFLGVDKPDTTATQILAPSSAPQAPQLNFTFPTSTTTAAPTAPISTPTPASGFQFGSPQTNVAPAPGPVFSFGSNTQTSAAPVFGSPGPQQPVVQSGFNFGTPQPMTTPGANFSLTPNINFGTPSTSSNQPFAFQAHSTQGQGDTTPRKIRRAVRRTK
jgi:hypothetical protein